MSWTTSFAIFFVIWWITLFAVLPWGVRSADESGATIAPGTDPGAPMLPRMRLKLVWTTLVAAIVFGLFYVVYTSGTVTLDDLATLWGLLPK